MKPWVYLVAGVIAAVLVAVMLKWKGRVSSGSDPIGAVAAFFILAGVLFGEDQNLAYGFMGFGAALFAILQLIKSKE